MIERFQTSERDFGVLKTLDIKTFNVFEFGKNVGL